MEDTFLMKSCLGYVTKLFGILITGQFSLSVLMGLLVLGEEVRNISLFDEEI